MKGTDLQTRFYEIFGAEGERSRIFFAPGRVNLIGEHTDYHGGRCLPIALGMGIYAAARRRQDRTVRLASLNEQEGTVYAFSLDEDLAPKEGDGWIRYPKAVMQVWRERGFAMPAGMEILLWGDLPSRSGLASSAALEVLFAFILRELYGEDLMDNLGVALLAASAEESYAGRDISPMGQVASALGREGQALFYAAQSNRIEFVPLQLGSARLLLTDTGIRIDGALDKYRERTTECEKALKKLKVVTNVTCLCDLSLDTFNSCKDVIMNEDYTKRARHVVTENVRTIRAVSALRVGNLKRFGEFMTQSHISLRDDYEVSCPELDYLAELAWETPGVLGSRMTGAGLGGCTLTLLEEEAIPAFKERVNALYSEKFAYSPAFCDVVSGDGMRELVL